MFWFYYAYRYCLSFLKNDFLAAILLSSGSAVMYSPSILFTRPFSWRKLSILDASLFVLLIIVASFDGPMLPWMPSLYSVLAYTSLFLTCLSIFLISIVSIYRASFSMSLIRFLAWFRSMGPIVDVLFRPKFTIHPGKPPRIPIT